MENPPEMWDRLIAINLMGAVRLTRAVLPPMIEARAGKIVNISSDAGRVGSMGETVYAAAKGGLIAFTKSLAREMARYRINVNCVCPGPTDTPLFQRQPERMREALTRAIPFRRIAQPEEIAEAVMFFLGRRIGLHHRPGAERQRRLDDGGLSARSRRHDRRSNERRMTMPAGIRWALAAALMIAAAAAPVPAQTPRERERRAECPREPAIRAAACAAIRRSATSGCSRNAARSPIRSCTQSCVASFDCGAGGPTAQTSRRAAVRAVR